MVVLRTLLLLALGGCRGEPPPGTTVSDSVGVRLTVSVDAPVVFAVLDSVPSLSIGGPDAPGPGQFFRIQNVLVDRAGRIWVADGQSGELRIFLANGTHWKTLGGRGEGPGEFLQVRLLGAVSGDTVLTGDSGADRITVWSPEGEFVRTERLPSGERPAPRPFDVFPDGSILGQLPRIVAAASLQPGQILPDSVELVRVGLNPPSVQPYGAASGPLWLWTGRSQIPLPFTVNASFDVAGEAVLLVAGPDFRVRVLEGERLRESLGVERERRAVDARDFDSYRAFVEEYIPDTMRPDYLGALDHELRPSLLPAYDRVLASADGHVWAQVYESDLASPLQWDVFDGDRRFVGHVSVPGGLYPMAITADGVVGVWRDAMGVEYVRVYPFTGS